MNMQIVQKLNPFASDKKVSKKRQKQIEEDYPFTGSCPVRERTADGTPVGRCWFATYGEYCSRHGKLSDYLVPTDRELEYESIDENDIPVRSEREFAPDEVFRGRQ